MRSIVVLAVCGLVVGCGRIPLHEKSTQSSSQSSSNQRPADAPVRLAPDATVLPEAFTVDSAKEIHDSLIGKAEKGETQTTPEFLEGQRHDHDALLWVVMGDPLAVTYDADTERLSVRLTVAKPYRPEGSVLYLPISKETSSKSYEASNAFGVKVKVQEIQQVQFGFGAFPLLDRTWQSGRIGSEGADRFVTATKPLGRDEATALLARRTTIKFVLWGRPATGQTNRLGHDRNEIKATITSPTSLITEMNYTVIDAKSVQVWIIDQQEKEVLVKTTLLALLGSSETR